MQSIQKHGIGWTYTLLQQLVHKPLIYSSFQQASAFFITCSLFMIHIRGVLQQPHFGWPKCWWLWQVCIWQKRSYLPWHEHKNCFWPELLLENAGTQLECAECCVMSSYKCQSCFLKEECWYKFCQLFWLPSLPNSSCLAWMARSQPGLKLIKVVHHSSSMSEMTVM